LQPARFTSGRLALRKAALSRSERSPPADGRFEHGTPDATLAGGGLMPSILLALATIGFFALSWGYARLCEKL
jgi:hypothetical protein